MKLLGKGADPYVKDSNGMTVLHACLYNSLPPYITDSDDLGGVTRFTNCFKFLAQLGHPEQNQSENITDSFVKPIDLNALWCKGPIGRSVLHETFRGLRYAETSEEMSFYSQCFDLLLESPSINVDLLDKRENTSLHIAANLGTCYIKLFC